MYKIKTLEEADGSVESKPELVVIFVAKQRLGGLNVLHLTFFVIGVHH